MAFVHDGAEWRNALAARFLFYTQKSPRAELKRAEILLDLCVCVCACSVFFHLNTALNI